MNSVTVKALSWLGVALLVLVVIILIAATSGFVPQTHVDLTFNPPEVVAVPTDDGLVSSTEAGVMCNAGAALPPVVGVLQADPSDSAWPVWLRGADGRRMYIRWPRGFSVRFDAGPALLDETGVPVLFVGSSLKLAQVHFDPANGTKDRPYLASGVWSVASAEPQRCYIKR